MPSEDQIQRALPESQPHSDHTVEYLLNAFIAFQKVSIGNRKFFLQEETSHMLQCVRFPFFPEEKRTHTSVDFNRSQTEEIFDSFDIPKLGSIFQKGLRIP